MKTMDFSKNWTFWRGRSPERKTLVDVPHDALISERRGPNAPSGVGGAYFYGDVYTYEKTFFASSGWSGQCVTLEFEGAYEKADIFLNEEHIAFHAYGYTGFFVPLDPYLKYGEANKVTVVLDNSRMPNSRWYPGAGLYRPVKLHIQNKTHIALEGVQIFTERLEPAVVRVRTEANGGEVSVDLRRGGKTVGTGTGRNVEISVPGAELWSAEHPNLYECAVTLTEDGEVVDEVVEPFGIRTLEWSPKGLFVNGEETLLRGGCVHHDNGIMGSAAYEEAERRRIAILRKTGFNAIRSAHNPCSKAMLRACDELGMYVVDEAFDMWYTHKTPFDNADRFEETGMLDIEAMVKRDVNHPSVIMYSLVNEPTELSSKKGQKYMELARETIHAIDQTRPLTAGVNLLLATSALLGVGVGAMYSEADEVEEEFDEFGIAVPTGKYAEPAKTKNASEIFNLAFQAMGPIMNYMVNNPLTDRVTKPIYERLDIGGYNYGSGRYKHDLKKYPDRIFYGSETLRQDISKNWDMVKKYPAIIGDFMWTAWDYLGEVGGGGWSYVDDGMPLMKHYPWMIADDGAVDLIGHVDVEGALAGVVWEQTSDPQLWVRPANHPGVKPTQAIWRGSNARHSWSWEGCEGNETMVEVFSKAPYVELFINGRSKGIRRTKHHVARFNVKYEPGTLQAIAYDGSFLKAVIMKSLPAVKLAQLLHVKGPEIRTAVLRSAEGNLNLKLSLEGGPEPVKPGALVFVDVDIAGENGVVESNADRDVTVRVDGGSLVAFGSAIQSTTARYQSGTFPTYYGRALAVVRAEEPEPGTRRNPSAPLKTLTVMATTEDGLSASTAINILNE